MNIISTQGKRICALAMTSLVLAGYAKSGYTQTYLFTGGSSLTNPALIGQVKHQKYFLGGVVFDTDNTFTGSLTGPLGSVSGAASSDQTDFLPYGQAAVRLSPEFVAGINVSEPWWTNFVFPSTSFINPVVIVSQLRGVDIDPMLSWQVTKTLTLAAGINIDNIYHSRIAFNVPPLGQLNNVGKPDWAVGWNAGLFYVIQQGTYISASYFSQIKHHLDTTSTLGPVSVDSNPQGYKTYVVLPAVATADLIQYVTQAWAVDAQVRYLWWNNERFLVLPNPPIGVVTLPQHYHNTFNFALSTKYDITELWSAMGFAAYSPSEQAAAYDSPGLPVGNGVSFGIGGEYKVTQNFKATLAVAHAMQDPKIANQTPAGYLAGHSNFHANAVDFRITYEA